MRSTARRRTMSPVPEDTISFWLGAYAERVLTARGDERRLKRVFFTSPLPMVLVDDERRYADANIPARLALRLSRGEIRQRRAGDLAPPDLVPVLDESWRRMLETGCVAGRSDVASPPGSSMEITYYSVANALPGLHLSVFLPADWAASELATDAGQLGVEPDRPMTARELEVLELAAEGRTGPIIAAQLGVSPATVSTHLDHIYTKLGVRDRAGAVAVALRLGLIV